MKKIILLVTIFLMSGLCSAQEWFTSFEVAKRLALVQDKLLFVMWEESLDYEFPVILFDEKGTGELVDLRKNEFINQVIWENFVPVKLPEFEYAKFSNQVKETRGLAYYNKLIDDSIKIMDVNGNILNVSDSDDTFYYVDDYAYLSINDFIKRYALNTSLLKMEFENYLNEKNFVTSYRLGSNYVDYAIFVRKDLRPGIINLANIYFGEAKTFLAEDDEKRTSYLQRLDLENISELLILNNPKKARRLLKKMEDVPIDGINQRLFAFLNYTVFIVLKDEKNAALWRDKMTSLNLKKAQFILSINSSTNGKSN